jgi:SprT-like protein
VSDDDALTRLRAHYRRVARAKFAGGIPLDFTIVFNRNLRRLTGRISYKHRLIEISRYHYGSYGLDDAQATLEHELLHLYLHELGRPSGHNAEFKALARQLDIRIYHANAYPRNRATPYRWLYECPACGRMVFRIRKDAARLACGLCCRTHASGRWHARYELRLLDRVRMV